MRRWRCCCRGCRGRPILRSIPSVTGGHSFFGGPLNSYTLHSVAEVTRRIRDGANLALVHANGGFLTYQHCVLLSAAAHADGYVGDRSVMARSMLWTSSRFLTAPPLAVFQPLRFQLGSHSDAHLMAYCESDSMSRGSIEDLNQQSNQLQQQLNSADGFDAAVGGRVVRDSLAGRTVVVITAPDADRSSSWSKRAAAPHPPQSLYSALSCRALPPRSGVSHTPTQAAGCSFISSFCSNARTAIPS